MEFIILGLLLLKPMTSYEIRRFIKTNLSLICSDSAGSVQTALKKLLLQGKIEFQQHVENGKNKKIYSVTLNGKNNFLSWVQSPMQSEKVKNMELSKLFFLGIAPENSRKEMINQYISQLTTMKNTLLSLKKEFNKVKSNTLSETNEQRLCDVLEYQTYTLDYGLAAIEFEMDWYTKLLKRIGE
jgi:DNA-binding PadR family transcriptional regulator